MLIDFVHSLLNIALVLFAVRWVQTFLDPQSDFGKAVAFIFH